jgi:hypothetical protein
MRTERVLIAVAIALSVVGVAVALHPYFPAQDGPQHLLTIHLEQELRDPATPLQRYYYPRLQHHWTYLGMELSVLALARLVPLAVADRLMVIGLALGFALALIYLLRRANPGSPLLLLAAPALQWNWLFHMGFWNLILGYTLALFAVGAVVPRLERLRRRDVVFLFVVLTAVGAVHPFALAFAVGVLVMLAALRPGRGRRLAAVLRVGAAALPGVAIVARGLAVDLRASEIMPAAEAAPAVAWSTVGHRLLYFPARICFGSSRYALALYGLLGAGVAVCAASAARERWRARARDRSAASVSGADAMLAVAAAAFVGYLFLPHQLGQTVSFVADRQAVFVLVLFLAWLPVPAWAGRKTAIAAVTAVVLLQAASFAYVRQWNRVLREFTSGAPRVSEGARILPMVFDTTGEIPTFAFPLIEAWSYYAVERDAVSPYSFAAGPQVGVGYRRDAFERELPHHGLYEAERGRGEPATTRALLGDARAYDYALLWRAPAAFLATARGEGFTTAFENGRLILLRPPGRGDPAPVRGLHPVPATPWR